MPASVAAVLWIECALIVGTTLFLTKPDFGFRSMSEKVRRMMKGIGFVLLCLTFCWSVIVGILMTMNQMTFQL